MHATEAGPRTSISKKRSRKHYVIDFETRSRRDLNSTSAFEYAAHESTRVLCMSYGETAYDVDLWLPGDPFPFEEDWPNVVLHAANAEFEWCVWNYCTDWPPLPVKSIHCLQARAAYVGLPRSVGKIGKPLGLADHGKDEQGHKVMLEMSKPYRASFVNGVFQGGKWKEDGYDRLYEYCVRDTQTEHFMHRLTPHLPQAEQELWRVNFEINKRGVPVDIPLCRNAVILVERARQNLNERLSEITDKKVVAATQLAKLSEWIGSRGVQLSNMQESTVRAAAKTVEDKLVREALNIRLLTRSASVAKYQSILSHAEAGRCRGTHVFYQAGPGRFASKGPQFQNMARLPEDDLERYLDLADRLSVTAKPQDVLTEDVIPTLGDMVRLAVRAPEGRKLIVCDFSGIELRGLHWLARDTRTLQQLRDQDAGRGEDFYKLNAALIYGKRAADVTKDERQLGKVMALGCGYLTGATKFHRFATNVYKVPMELDRAQELVQLYRRSFPAVTKFWRDVEKCVLRAVEGKPMSLGRLGFERRGPDLIIILPSGRELWYRDAVIGQGEWGPEVNAYDARYDKVVPIGLPKWVENITQATCRDILRDALIDCHNAGLQVVLHVHDEIVIEADESDNRALGRLQDIMSQTPGWAQGFPVHAKAGEGIRYIK